MSDIINFSSRKKMQLVLDSFSIIKEDILDNSEEQIKQIALEEYERGYQTCKDDLLLQFQERKEHEIAELKEYNNSIILDINDQLNSLQEDLPKTILNISLIIAEKIITRQVDLNTNIREQLESILKKVLGAVDVTIRLNPEDLKQFGNELKNVKIFEDENIERGGCFVETEIGNIDARIFSRMSELKKSIEIALLENI